MRWEIYDLRDDEFPKKKGVHWSVDLKSVINMHFYGCSVACNAAGECKITGLNLYDRAFLEKLLVAQLNETNCVFYRTQESFQHQASGLYRMTDEYNPWP